MEPRLGVNIDHIATLRQLRRTAYPDLLQAARLVESAGGHQITVHLREDRRHIHDDDVKILRRNLKIPLNLEMSVAEGIVRIATKLRPDWACLVPEKRQELTTEGGLDVRKNKKRVGGVIRKLKKAGVRVSCFIEPSLEMVKISHELGADAVEFHTGKYCLAYPKPASKSEMERIRKSARLCRKLGIAPHAGHGFDYENVRPVAALEDDGNPLIEEYNIGHSIVCRAALVGLESAVRQMLSAILAP